MEKIEFTLQDKKKLRAEIQLLIKEASSEERDDFSDFQFNKAAAIIQQKIKIAKSQIRANQLGWGLISIQN